MRDARKGMWSSDQRRSRICNYTATTFVYKWGKPPTIKKLNQILSDVIKALFTRDILTNNIAIKRYF